MNGATQLLLLPLTLLALAAFLVVGSVRHTLELKPYLRYDQSLHVVTLFQTLGPRKATRRIASLGLKRPAAELLVSGRSLPVIALLVLGFGAAVPIVVTPLPAAAADQLAILVQAQAAVVSLGFVGIIFVFQYLQGQTYDETTMTRFIKQTRLMPILYVAIVSTAVVIGWFVAVSVTGEWQAAATNGTVLLMTATLAGIVYLYSKVPSIAAENPLDRSLRTDLIAEVKEQYLRLRLRTKGEQVLAGRHSAIRPASQSDQPSQSLPVTKEGDRRRLTDVHLGRLSAAVERSIEAANKNTGSSPQDESSAVSRREDTTDNGQQSTAADGTGYNPGPVEDDSSPPEFLVNLGNEKSPFRGAGSLSDGTLSTEELQQIVRLGAGGWWSGSGTTIKQRIQQLSRRSESAIEDRNQAECEEHLETYEQVGKTIIDESAKLERAVRAPADTFARPLRQSLLHLFQLTTEVEDEVFAGMVSRTTRNLIDHARKQQRAEIYEEFITLWPEFYQIDLKTSGENLFERPALQFNSVFDSLVEQAAVIDSEESQQNEESTAVGEMIDVTIEQYSAVCLHSLRAGEHSVLAALLTVETAVMERLESKLKEFADSEPLRSGGPGTRYDTPVELANQVDAPHLRQLIHSLAKTGFAITALAFEHSQSQASGTTRLRKLVAHRIENRYNAARPTSIVFTNLIEGHGSPKWRSWSLLDDEPAVDGIEAPEVRSSASEFEVARESTQQWMYDFYAFIRLYQVGPEGKGGRSGRSLSSDTTNRLKVSLDQIKENKPLFDEFDALYTDFQRRRREVGDPWTKDDSRRRPP